MVSFTIRILTLFLCLLGGFHYARGQTVSPDGTVITAPTGTLTTSQGTWSWGDPNGADYQVRLNGANNGAAVTLQITNGSVYAHASYGTWFLWSGTSWSNLGATPPVQKADIYTLMISKNGAPATATALPVPCHPASGSAIGIDSNGLWLCGYSWMTKPVFGSSCEKGASGTDGERIYLCNGKWSGSIAISKAPW